MSRPAALLALLCILAACSSDPKESTEDSGVESEPAGPSSAIPTVQPSTPTSPDTTAASMAPADTSTTLPATTLEEAAPPPEP
ncbi:MAG TPA: hypothetical protein VGB92_15550 [Longimicrobium sp.]